MVLHIPAIGAEHIVRLAQELPVQSDFCQRIQSSTNQFHPILIEEILLHPEFATVLPIAVSDPLHYVEAVDGVLFLVMAGQTPRDIVQRGVEILRGVGANLLGVVANNLGEVLPYYYDHKYYGYGEKNRKK